MSEHEESPPEVVATTSPAPPRRIWLFRLIAGLLALLFSTLLALGVFALHVKACERKGRSVSPTFREIPLVRWIFESKEWRDLVEATTTDAAAREAVDRNTRDGLISRDVFDEMLMYGEYGWRYRPNIDVTSARVWSGLEYRVVVMRESPRTRAALDAVPHLEETTFHTDPVGCKKSSGPAIGAAPSLLFVGDSFTEGMHVPSEKTFVSRLSLAMVAAGFPAAPVNTGVSGYDARHYAWSVENSLKTLKPKLVLVSIFANDIEYDYYRVIHGEAAEDSWTRFFGWIEHIEKDCAAREVGLVLSLIPVKEQLADPGSCRHYQQRIHDWAKGRPFQLIDSFEALQAAGAERVYFDWDPHFSPGGHEIYAEFLMSSLRERLATLYAPKR